MSPRIRQTCSATIEIDSTSDPRCRKLAEALRPSIDLFHESLCDGESLPGYHGELDQAEQSSIESVMQRVRDEEPRPTVKPITIRRVDPLSVAAAAIAGLVLGVIARIVWRRATSTAQHQVDSNASYESCRTSHADQPGPRSSLSNGTNRGERAFE